MKVVGFPVSAIVSVPELADCPFSHKITWLLCVATTIGEKCGADVGLGNVPGGIFVGCVVAPHVPLNETS